MISNPEIYDHESRSVKEYIDPITISSVDEYVEKKGYNQFAKLNKEIAASSSGRPKWVASANEVLAQPGAAGIDLQLALAIAVRESGSGGLTSGESIESFSNSGLDFLFTSGKRWAQQGLVPKDWVKGSDFTEGNHTSSDGKGKSAWVPAERMLGFFFAAIGAARLHLEEKVSACYGLGGSESEALIDGLPVLARRIWVAISFAGPGGSIEDLATVKPGNTGVLTFLQAFHDAGIPLDAILDIPAALSKVEATSAEVQAAVQFLNRSLTFDRLTIATKTAIAATALDSE